MGEIFLVYVCFSLATASPGDLPVDWFHMPFQDSYWLWKGVGFTGLALFQARWVVQWLHSEKHKESRMPVSFWWFSLIGSMLELCYFLRQQDSVGIVGCLNFLPYLRNLVLIYRKRKLDALAGEAIANGQPASAGEK